MNKTIVVCVIRKAENAEDIKACVPNVDRVASEITLADIAYVAEYGEDHAVVKRMDGRAAALLDNTARDEEFQVKLTLTGLTPLVSFTVFVYDETEKISRYRRVANSAGILEFVCDIPAGGYGLVLQNA
ncbi:MAG: hypothetical protein IKX10_09535 [Lachnospiraceae bacterium]|nr:hypothetical protein [Lachnospiraceae bacterium]